ncbi:ATP-binding cassette domain-containing protein [soil metagenome]
MIQLEKICKTFNKGEAAEIKVIPELSLTIAPGTFCVIVGANGSGKSTLLNLIAGTFSPDSGKIILNNTDVTALADYRRSIFISRIFQNPLQGTAPELSVLDNFRLAALRTQPKGLSIGTTNSFKDLVAEKIKILKLGLEDKLMQSMSSLSGGQRQALTLVMATMDDCKILLMDEPTAALDPRSSALVMEKAAEIIKLNQLTAILVTHQMKDALRYGDRLIQLQEGNILRDLSRENKEILKNEELYSWFND